MKKIKKKQTKQLRREGGHRQQPPSLSLPAMACFLYARDPLPVTRVRVVMVRVAFTHTLTLGHDKNPARMPLPTYTHLGAPTGFGRARCAQNLSCTR